jgi:hypothetical protein
MKDLFQALISPLDILLILSQLKVPAHFFQRKHFLRLFKNARFGVTAFIMLKMIDLGRLPLILSGKDKNSI